MDEDDQIDPVDPNDPVDGPGGKFREPTDYERRLRSETAKHRKERREAEAKLKELQDSLSSKEATIRSEAEANAQAKADARIIRSELKFIATKMDLVDPDALAFIDTSKLKLDDKGEVIGAEDALKALKEAKPYLFGEKTSTTSETKPPKPGDPAPKSALEMSPEEFKAAKAKMLSGR